MYRPLKLPASKQRAAKASPKARRRESRALPRPGVPTGGANQDPLPVLAPNSAKKGRATATEPAADAKLSAQKLPAVRPALPVRENVELSEDDQEELFALIEQAVATKKSPRTKPKAKKRKSRGSSRRSSLHIGGKNNPLGRRVTVPEQLYDDEERSWTRAGKEKIARLKAEERRRRRLAAIKIQANYRARFYRHRYLSYRATAKKAIVGAQRLFRSLKARRHLASARRGATAMAAVVRGHLQRQLYRELQERRRIAATRIQVQARGRAARRAYAHDLKQALRVTTWVQSHVRRRQAMHEFAVKKAAAVSIQKIIRGTVQRRRFLALLGLRHSMATSLQAHTRRWQQRKRYQRMLKRREAAAVVLQAQARGRAQRRRYKARLAEILAAKQTKAALAIVSVARGHLTRVGLLRSGIAHAQNMRLRGTTRGEVAPKPLPEVIAQLEKVIRRFTACCQTSHPLVTEAQDTCAAIQAQHNAEQTLLRETVRCRRTGSLGDLQRAIERTIDAIADHGAVSANDEMRILMAAHEKHTAASSHNAGIESSGTPIEASKPPQVMFVTAARRPAVMNAKLAYSRMERLSEHRGALRRQIWRGRRLWTAFEAAAMNNDFMSLTKQLSAMDAQATAEANVASQEVAERARRRGDDDVAVATAAVHAAQCTGQSALGELLEDHGSASFHRIVKSAVDATKTQVTTLRSIWTRRLQTACEKAKTLAQQFGAKAAEALAAGGDAEVDFLHAIMRVGQNESLQIMLESPNPGFDCGRAHADFMKAWLHLNSAFRSFQSACHVCPWLMDNEGSPPTHSLQKAVVAAREELQALFSGAAHEAKSFLAAVATFVSSPPDDATAFRRLRSACVHGLANGLAGFSTALPIPTAQEGSELAASGNDAPYEREHTLELRQDSVLRGLHITYECLSRDGKIAGTPLSELTKQSKNEMLARASHSAARQARRIRKLASARQSLTDAAPANALDSETTRSTGEVHSAPTAPPVSPLELMQLFGETTWGRPAAGDPTEPEMLAIRGSMISAAARASHFVHLNPYMLSDEQQSKSIKGFVPEILRQNSHKDDLALALLRSVGQAKPKLADIRDLVVVGANPTRSVPNVNGRNPDGHSALSLAVSIGSVAAVEILLQALVVQSVMQSATTSAGEISLDDASIVEPDDASNVLLQAWLNQRVYPANNGSVLHIAASTGNTDICRLLLTAKIDPWALNASRFSALHIAALAGHPECVRALLFYSIAEAKIEGAEQEAACVRRLQQSTVCGAGLTPLHCAIIGGNAAVAEVLLNALCKRIASRADAELVSKSSQQKPAHSPSPVRVRRKKLAGSSSARDVGTNANKDIELDIQEDLLHTSGPLWAEIVDLPATAGGVRTSAQSESSTLRLRTANVTPLAMAVALGNGACAVSLVCRGADVVKACESLSIPKAIEFAAVQADAWNAEREQRRTGHVQKFKCDPDSGLPSIVSAKLATAWDVIFPETFAAREHLAEQVHLRLVRFISSVSEQAQAAQVQPSATDISDEEEEETDGDEAYSALLRLDRVRISKACRWGLGGSNAFGILSYVGDVAIIGGLLSSPSFANDATPLTSATGAESLLSETNDLGLSAKAILEDLHGLSLSALRAAAQDGSFHSSVVSVRKKVANKALTYWKSGALRRFKRGELAFLEDIQGCEEVCEDRASSAKTVEYVRGLDVLSLLSEHFKLEQHYSLRHLLHIIAFCAMRQGRLPFSQYASFSADQIFEEFSVSEVLALELDYSAFAALFEHATLLVHARAKWGTGSDGIAARVSPVASVNAASTKSGGKNSPHTNFLPQMEVLKVLKDALKALPQPKKKDKALNKLRSALRQNILAVSSVPRPNWSFVVAHAQLRAEDAVVRIALESLIVSKGLAAPSAAGKTTTVKGWTIERRTAAYNKAIVAELVQFQRMLQHCKLLGGTSACLQILQRQLNASSISAEDVLDQPTAYLRLRRVIRSCKGGGMDPANGTGKRSRPGTASSVRPGTGTKLGTPNTNKGTNEDGAMEIESDISCESLPAADSDEMINVGTCVSQSVANLRACVENIVLAHSTIACCGPGGDLGLAELRNRKHLLQWTVADIVLSAKATAATARVICRRGCRDPPALSEMFMRHETSTPGSEGNHGSAHGMSSPDSSSGVEYRFVGYSPLMLHIISTTLGRVGPNGTLTFLDQQRKGALARSASSRATIARKNSSLALGQALAAVSGPYAGVQTLLAMKSSVRAVAPDGNNALACAVSVGSPPGLIEALLCDEASGRMIGATVGKPSSFSFQLFSSVSKSEGAGDATASIDRCASSTHRFTHARTSRIITHRAFGKSFSERCCISGLSAILAAAWTGQVKTMKLFLDVDAAARLCDEKNTLSRTRDGYSLFHLLVIAESSESASTDALLGVSTACSTLGDGKLLPPQFQKSYARGFAVDEDLRAIARLVFSHWVAQIEKFGPPGPAPGAQKVVGLEMTDSNSTELTATDVAVGLLERPASASGLQRSPLNLAAASGCEWAVDCLLELKADPYAQDASGKNAFANALEANSTTIMQMLLSSAGPAIRAAAEPAWNVLVVPSSDELPARGESLAFLAARSGSFGVLAVLCDFFDESVVPPEHGSSWVAELKDPRGSDLSVVLERQHSLPSLQTAREMGRLEVTLQYTRKHFMRSQHPSKPAGITQCQAAMLGVERLGLQNVWTASNPTGSVGSGYDDARAFHSLKEFVDSVKRTPYMAHFRDAPGGALCGGTEWEVDDTSHERVLALAMQCVPTFLSLDSELVHVASVEACLEKLRTRHAELTKELHPDLHVFKPSPSALFYACRKGNAKLIVDLVVNRGTPVDCVLPGRPMVTPLSIAVRFGQSSAVRALLDLKASLPSFSVLQTTSPNNSASCTVSPCFQLLDAAIASQSSATLKLILQEALRCAKSDPINADLGTIFRAESAADSQMQLAAPPSLLFHAVRINNAVAVKAVMQSFDRYARMLQKEQEEEVGPGNADSLGEIRAKYSNQRFVQPHPTSANETHSWSALGEAILNRNLEMVKLLYGWCKSGLDLAKSFLVFPTVDSKQKQIPVTSSALRVALAANAPNIVRYFLSAESDVLALLQLSDRDACFAAALSSGEIMVTQDMLNQLLDAQDDAWDQEETFDFPEPSIHLVFDALLLGDFETVALFFDLVEDLEVRRHSETGDSIALASFVIFGRSSDDMLEVTLESVKPIFNREMHKRLKVRETRDEMLNGEHLASAAWKLYSQENEKSGSDPTLSTRRMRLFLNQLFPALEGIYGPIYYSRLVQLLLAMIASQSVEVHIPATPAAAGDAAWAIEGEAVSAEQFQRWFSRVNVTMLMGLWLAYAMNGDGPPVDGTVAEIGTTPSRYSTLDALIEAVEVNDDEAVFLCARRGKVDLDSVAEEISATALGLAASCGYYEVTAQLLGLGASVDAAYGPKSMTPFLSAAVENNVDIINLFLAGKRPSQDLDDDPLACASASWTGGLLLLETQRSQSGASALLMAVIYKHLSVVDAIFTAIDALVFPGPTDTFELADSSSAVEPAADVFHEKTAAKSAADAAAEIPFLYRVGGAKNIPPALYALFGVDATQVKAFGKEVTENGAPVQPSLLGRMCEAKCFDINHRYRCNDEMFTLLQLAIWWKIEAGLKLLLQHGADAQCAVLSAEGDTDSDNVIVLAEEPWEWAGVTTLGLAVMLGSHSMVAALIQHGVVLHDNSMGLIMESSDELMAAAFLGRFPLMKYMWNQRHQLLKDRIDELVGSGTEAELAKTTVLTEADKKLNSVLEKNHSISLTDLWSVLQTVVFKGDLVALAPQTIEALGDTDAVFDELDDDDNAVLDKYELRRYLKRAGFDKYYGLRFQQLYDVYFMRGDRNKDSVIQRNEWAPVYNSFAALHQVVIHRNYDGALGDKAALELTAALADGRSDTRVLRDRFLFFRSMAEAAKLEHEAPTDQDIEDLGVAAEEDDIESILRLVLVQKVSVDAVVSAESYTPLMSAACFGCKHALPALLMLGGDPNIVAKDNFTPLLLCARNNDTGMISTLLQCRQKSSTMSPQQTWLMNVGGFLFNDDADKAAHASHRHLQDLSDDTPLPVLDVGLSLPSGANAVFLAVQCNNIETLQLLRELVHPKILASIVNQTVEISGQKCTALFVAALKNYADIVQELIMFPGLDLNAKNQNAQLTALYAAVTKRNEDSAVALIEAGASWDAPADSDTSALHWGALLGSKRIVTALLGADNPHPMTTQHDIDSGRYKSSAVMRSAFIGDFAMVQLFLLHQSDDAECLDVVSCEGLTVEDILSTGFGVDLFELDDIVADEEEEEAEAAANPDAVDEEAVQLFYKYCVEIPAPAVDNSKKKKTDETEGSDSGSDSEAESIEVVQVAQLGVFLAEEMNLHARFKSNWDQFVQFEVRRFSTPTPGRSHFLTLRQFTGAAYRRWCRLAELQPDKNAEVLGHAHHKDAVKKQRARLANAKPMPKSAKNTGFPAGSGGAQQHAAATAVQKLFRGAQARRKNKVSLSALRQRRRQQQVQAVRAHSPTTEEFENESFDETTVGSVSEDGRNSPAPQGASRANQLHAQSGGAARSLASEFDDHDAAEFDDDATEQD